MTDPRPAHGAEASPLGKSAAYRNTYAPELLFPVPRAAKRAELGLGAALPFVGEDVWNAYEVSWLDPRGKPVVAMGEFRVPAASPRLIESKSLKLYLNSFNAMRLDAMAAVEARIAQLTAFRFFVPDPVDPATEPASVTATDTGGAP